MLLKIIWEYMFKFIIFYINEGRRLFAVNKRINNKFLLLLFLRYTLLALSLMLIFNINYFLEVNSGIYPDNPLLVTLHTSVAFIKRYQISIYIIVLILFLLLCQTNLQFFSHYYYFYRPELLLLQVIDKRKKGEVLVWFFILFLNLIAVISAWITGLLLYRGLNQLYFDFCFLDLFNFKLSLFTLLLINSFLSLIIGGSLIKQLHIKRV